MPETWAHRADLAESGVTERHAQKLWGMPKTNLAVVTWPPGPKDRAFWHWHYWWQAQYLDCQVDAATRRGTKTRRRRIADTLRGIQRRNRGKLTANRHFDDKAWLALAWNHSPGSSVRSLRESSSSGKTAKPVRRCACPSRTYWGATARSW